MEVMALYPANSLFLDGYLNTKGGERARTLQMIKDAGFIIKSNHDIDKLIANEQQHQSCQSKDPVTQALIKDLKDLRPEISSSKI